MAQICNKEQELASTNEIYDRVDRPIATGSAHFMRAGAELHLLHADLELSDPTQAALRVASARAAIGAATDSYWESHQLAEELDFYQIHDERLASAGRGNAGVLDTLRDAQSRGLVERCRALAHPARRETAVRPGWCRRKRPDARPRC